MNQELDSRGTKQVHDGRTFIEFTRTFRAPIAHVWAAVTESDRLGRWIGEWTGDPAEGAVKFRMTYEGDEHTPERMQIDECEAPRLLRLTSTVLSEGEQQQWHFRLDLTETDGVTTLLFAQDVPTPAMAEGVGPGWEYYLDRLVVAEGGGDPATIVWDDYYPALKEHYQALFA